MTPNREQIEAEPAGPRLNAWVGEALCLPKRFRCPKCGGDYFRGDLEQPQGLECETKEHGVRCRWRGEWADVPWPDYSGDIRAAWAVLLEMIGRPFSVRLQFFAALKELSRLPSGDYPDGLWALATLGESFPAAVCKAALAAAIRARGEAR
jgi:hypothetical protein